MRLLPHLGPSKLGLASGNGAAKRNFPFPIIQICLFSQCMSAVLADVGGSGTKNILPKLLSHV